MKKKKQRREGFALVELLIATGVVTMVMVAVAAGVAMALKNSRYSKEKSQSIRLAQEAIEWMRNRRDVLGWRAVYQAVDADQPATGDLIYCLEFLPDGSSEFVELEHSDENSCGYIANTNYRRIAKINLPDVGTVDGTIDLSILVTWDDGSDVRNTNLNASLTHWR